MNKTNTGKIQMVVFDWAGTTVDYASSAPILLIAAMVIAVDQITGKLRKEILK